MKTTLTLLASLWIAVAATTDAAALEQFQSPSGNIGCAMSKSGVRCDIADRDWSPPPKPDWCELDWGGGVAVGRHGRAEIVCAGDTTLHAGRHLAYGDSLRVGRFRCTSRRSGMRCVNRRNEHGFVLSRERAKRF